MFQSIKTQNFLSFGDGSAELSLLPLNIIIGANGSGKSNFLEAFDLLQNAPLDITKPIREGGGVSDWLYKGGAEIKDAFLCFDVANSLPDAKSDLQYSIKFNNTVMQRFEITDEKIAANRHNYRKETPYIFYDYNDGKPIINVRGEDEKRGLKREDINRAQSILVQIRDAIHYPEITFLSHAFAQIKMYREWAFGRYTPARLPQKMDVRNDFLEADGSNLCMVLNQLRYDSPTKKRILKELRDFYAGVEDYEIIFFGGQAQIYFQEYGLRAPIPATRLSDGTLRYLYLLSVLCNPTPPPLICIEEPELGLHPDIIPNIAQLLQEAAERCQIIVTTHSTELVDYFTDTPETVIVAEKDQNGTNLKRLDKNELKPWLEKYSLGKLWTRGDIGGTRW